MTRSSEDFPACAADRETQQDAAEKEDGKMRFFTGSACRGPMAAQLSWEAVRSGPCTALPRPEPDGHDWDYDPFSDRRMRQ